MDISEFRSVIFDYGGLQKLDRYKLRFVAPPCMSGFVSNTGQPTLETVRDIEFFCNMVDLPGVALATRPILRYGYGVTEKKPAFTLFQDVMLNVMIDSGSINLEFFHQWISTIVNFQFYNTIRDSSEIVQNQLVDAYEVTYKSDYAIEASLTLYDVAGDESYTIVMRDFFPTLIPETKLAWELTQNVMNLVVMFSFTDWYIRPPIDQPNPVSALG